MLWMFLCKETSETVNHRDGKWGGAGAGQTHITRKDFAPPCARQPAPHNLLFFLLKIYQLSIYCIEKQMQLHKETNSELKLDKQNSNFHFESGCAKFNCVKYCQLLINP